MNGERNKDSLQLQILEKLSALATAAFGLVAALAWNDAIQSLFKRIFGEQSSLVAKFVYALVVTAVVVAITLRFSHAINRLKERLGYNDKPQDT